MFSPLEDSGTEPKCLRIKASPIAAHLPAVSSICAVETLVRTVKSANVYINTQHVKERMRERNVSIRQVLDVLQNGRGIDGPTLDQYGDWRVKLKRYTCGRVVQVVVVVKHEYIEVITVI